MDGSKNLKMTDPRVGFVEIRGSRRGWGFGSKDCIDGCLIVVGANPLTYTQQVLGPCSGNGPSGRWSFAFEKVVLLRSVAFVRPFGENLVYPGS